MSNDLELNEMRCSECQKPIPAIPQWLSDVKVRFQCEECRQKHPRGANVPEVVEPLRRSLSATEEEIPEEVMDPEDEVEEEEEEEADDGG